MYTKNFNLQILETGRAEASEIMAMDAKLLADLDPEGPPILHLYDWAGPSATYGHFIDLEKHLDLNQVAASRLSLARRPTGGGIVFHIWDLAFSFLMPINHPAFSKNTLENYRFVNEVVLDAVQEKGVLISEEPPALSPQCRHFCMAKPTIYDVVYQGKKVAGAAQRRTRQGYLHQGTISLAFPHLGFLRQVLLSKEEITRAMTAYTFAPLGFLWRPEALQKARRELQELLKQKFLAKLQSLAL